MYFISNLKKRLFDVRFWLTVAVTFIISICIYNHFKLQEEQWYVKILFETNSPSRMQLFYDTGRGFNEFDSKSFSYEDDVLNTLIIPLPFDQINDLRMDPSSALSQFRIHAFYISNLAQKIDIPLPLNTLKAYKGIEEWRIVDDKISFVTTNGDPQIRFRDIVEVIESAKIKHKPPQVERFLGYLLLLMIVFPLSLLFRDHFAYMFIVVGFWMIIYPGTYSPDSFWQLDQAIAHEYSNWHPPIMAIIIHYVLKVGLSLSFIVFVQLMLSIYSVRLLCFKVLEFFFPESRKETNCSIALLVVVMMVNPVSSFLFNATTLWKDIWVAILFLWVLVLVFHVAINVKYDRSPGLLSLVLLLFFTTICVLLRHNTILILLPVSVVMYVALIKYSMVLRITSILILVLLSKFSGVVIEKVYDVKNLHSENTVMSNELVGLMVLRPDLHNEFPHTSSALKSDYKERWQWSRYNLLRWYKPTIVDESYITDSRDERLIEEYKKAILNHPFTMAKVKILNFIPNLGIQETERYVEPMIARNEYGMEYNSQYRMLRGKIMSFTGSVANHSIYRWFYAVHFIYFIVCILCLIYALFWFFRERVLYRLLVISVFAIPFLYYCSYMLASVGRGYRYMLPSTWAIQCILFTVLLGFILKTIFSRFKSCKPT
ncbi:MAG: hypothetical protein MI748_19090 [Opitutales bacterium]|nr:hypothetical protein [Opitutales bacterium]